MRQSGPGLINIIHYSLNIVKVLRLGNFPVFWKSSVMGRILFTIMGAGLLLVLLNMGSETTTVVGKAPASTLTRLFTEPRDFLFNRNNEEPMTLLLLGKAGVGWTAGELTDTILVAELNGKNHSATVVSIPRDLLIRLPSGATAKINALWLIGKQDVSAKKNRDIREASELIRGAAEDVTGIRIDHVFVMDVAGAAKAIDVLGGIAVNVTERIDDPAFPTAGGGIERFSLDPGFHVLDGTTAVKYARTRHTKDGDFGRVRRQQQVLEALVAKMRGTKFSENPGRIANLAAGLSQNIETSLGITDMIKLAAFLNAIPIANVQTFSLERVGNESLLVGTAGTALVPRKGAFDYSEIRAAIAENLR